jgi:general secretion pathway protein G
MIRQETKIRKFDRSAFTLMEVLVVVAIIVALAALGGYLLINQFEQSKEGTAKAKIHTIEQAIDTYYIRVGDYPPDNQLAVLVQNGYLKRAADITDPWNQPFQYQRDATSPTGYRVWTINPKTQQPITSD